MLRILARLSALHLAVTCTAVTCTAVTCTAAGAVTSPADPSTDPHAAVAAAARAARDQDVLRALREWLEAYRRGRIDVLSGDDIAERSIAARHDVLPKGLLGRLTRRRELELLLDAAAQREDAETALAVLEFAAVGMDDREYAPAMAPSLVREAGERALARMTGESARKAILEVAAEGHRGAGRGLATAMRAAALRAVGATGDASHLPLIERHLTHETLQVRLAAADAASALANPEAIPELARAVEREREPRVLAAQVEALESILRTHRGAVGDRRTAPAVAAAVDALGRTTWRVDMAIIDLLEIGGTKQAVPPLIEVLQRFVDHPEKVRSGELSGLLRHRAHEALVALTGAYFASDAPDRWRTWWEGAAEDFEVREREPPQPGGAADAGAGAEAGEQADERGRTVAGFFGVPVHGTRVVFVIDLSLSMLAAMPLEPGRTTSGAIPDKMPTRLDAAREEVWKAVQRLEQDAHFNVIVFSEDARKWKRKLVRATDSNKKRLRRFLDSLEGEPYTNLWSGLAAALRLQPSSYATTGEQDVDEIFLLSDGAPTIGEITDEEEMLRVVNESNRFARVRINTVFIKGTDSAMDPTGDHGVMGPLELMRELARHNDGVFVEK